MIENNSKMVIKREQELKDVVNGHAVIYYRTYTFNSLHDLRRVGEMHGARRVIIFCLLTAVLPTILLIIPLYLRHSVFADETYAVAESDILEIGNGISTVFCQEHTLRMNSSFHAYQINGKPEIGNNSKRIRLKKSMSLPDDTLEYWGFYLPKGSHVQLSVCSRYEGSRVLVVKGERNLETCGLLEHSKTTLKNEGLAKDQGHVSVTYETNAQEIHSNGIDEPLSRSPDNNRTSNRTRRSLAANEDDNDAREVEDTEGMRTFKLVREAAENYINNHIGRDSKQLRTFEEKILGHKLRHSKRREKPPKKETGERKLGLSNSIIDERIENVNKIRKRRDVPLKTPHNLDAKIAHGGTAKNYTEQDSDDTSISSFERSLLTCYSGNILLQSDIPPSELCINTSSLNAKEVKNVKTTHDVVSDGYYYYIFYSDNDYVNNDIHAVFDIRKPTYQYANISKNCINSTECSFPVKFLSHETVIVEVPTRDGIEHEGDDITYLVSTCQPRMAIYIIFPILVLFLILGCAFL